MQAGSARRDTPVQQGFLLHDRRCATGTLAQPERSLIPTRHRFANALENSEIAKVAADQIEDISHSAATVATASRVVYHPRVLLRADLGATFLRDYARHT